MNLKVALIQMNAGPAKEENLRRAQNFVRQAVRQKARFVLLPEIFHYRGPNSKALLLKSVAEIIPGPSVFPFLRLAREERISILLGSIYEKDETRQRIYNTSVLINAQGKIMAVYRKRNLFLAQLPNKKIDERKNLTAGKELATGRVGDFRLGLSICYDLRFPEMYRAYGRVSANVLCAPSCFTRSTGQAHFEVLLRARAIENLAYVLAPNQVGTDDRGIHAYGNSMIIGPWGNIVARANGTQEGVLLGQLQMKEVVAARKFLPGVRCKGSSSYAGKYGFAC